MKKVLILFIGLFMVIITSGCDSNTKSMKCTKESVDGEGYKTTENVNVTYNSKKVLKVEQINIAETDPTYIDLALGFSNVFLQTLNDINGITITMNKIENNKIETKTKIDYEKLDIEKIKNNLSDLTTNDENLYSSVNYTIDEFKEKNLNGYTCH